MRPNTIHAASLESPRLAPILALLKSRGATGATTRELADCASVLSPNTAISELRQVLGDKARIDCTFEREANGRRIYRYRLVAVEGQLELFR